MNTEPLGNIYHHCIEKHIPFLSTKPALLYIGLSENTTMVYTYSDIHLNVLKICKILNSLKITTSDNIILTLPQIPETFFIILACARLQIHYLLLSPFLDPLTLKRIFEDFKPKYIFSASYCLNSIGIPNDFNKVINEVLESSFLNNYTSLIMIQREIYQTPIIKESRDLDFYTLISFCGGQEITMIIGEFDCDLFSVYQIFQKENIIKKTSNKTITTIEETMKNHNKNENKIWLCNYNLASVEGLCFGLFGPLFQGDTSILLETNEIEKEKYWELIDKFKVNCFCGEMKIFEKIEDVDCNLSSLVLFITDKNKGCLYQANKINEKNFDLIEVEIESQCFFENFYVKIETCDDRIGKIEKILREETCLESIFVIKINETLHIVADGTYSIEQKRRKIEEIGKKYKLNFKIWIEEIGKFMDSLNEKELRKSLKRNLLEKTEKNGNGEGFLKTIQISPKRFYMDSINDDVFLESPNKKIKF